MESSQAIQPLRSCQCPLVLMCRKSYSKHSSSKCTCFHVRLDEDHFKALFSLKDPSHVPQNVCCPRGASSPGTPLSVPDLGIVQTTRSWRIVRLNSAELMSFHHPPISLACFHAFYDKLRHEAHAKGLLE